MKDYYSILGVTPTAPKEVIVAAYTALALKLDPEGFCAGANPPRLAGTVAVGTG